MVYQMKFKAHTYDITRTLCTMLSFPSNLMTLQTFWGKGKLLPNNPGLDFTPPNDQAIASSGNVAVKGMNVVVQLPKLPVEQP